MASRNMAAWLFPVWAASCSNRAMVSASRVKALVFKPSFSRLRRLISCLVSAMLFSSYSGQHSCAALCVEILLFLVSCCRIRVLGDGC